MKVNLQHHAHLVVGERGQVLPAVLDLVAEVIGTTDAIHADKFTWEGKSFSVEDSRTLKEWQALIPVGKAKVAVIACETMTESAAQALLKVVEEPAVGVYFFIIVPNEAVLIPTLLSRLIQLKLESGANKNKKKPINDDGLILAEKFLAAAPMARLKQLDAISEPRELVRNLERVIAKQKLILKPEVFLEAGEAVRKAAARLDNPRVQAKLVLEALAFSLPLIKL